MRLRVCSGLGKNWFIYDNGRVSPAYDAIQIRLHFLNGCYATQIEFFLLKSHTYIIQLLLIHYFTFHSISLICGRATHFKSFFSILCVLFGFHHDVIEYFCCRMFWILFYAFYPHGVSQWRNILACEMLQAKCVFIAIAFATTKHTIVLTSKYKTIRWRKW